jgi:hypothetical protein
MLRAFAVAVLAVLLAAPAAAGARTPLPGVKSPSGNINCFYVPRPAHLLCGIRSAAYISRLQDACIARDGLDWHGWEVFPRRVAQVVCAGGILWDSNHDVPAPQLLPYGKTWTFGAFTCTSRRTGLTCRTSSGHGLFLSRASWRGW